MSTADIIVALLTLCGMVALYMLPSIVAFQRSHHQRWPILILNASFGWTVIAWIGCLAWAFSAVREPGLEWRKAS